MDKQYIKVKFCGIPHASLKKSFLFVQFWAAGGFCQRVQNSRICQRCDVKTSTVTPTFNYLFIIFLTCYISVKFSSTIYVRFFYLGITLRRGSTCKVHRRKESMLSMATTRKEEVVKSVGESRVHTPSL